MHRKIVYYGPSMSGKTTNLLYIHSNLAPELRRALIRDPQEPRIIWFNIFPPAFERMKENALTLTIATYQGASQPYGRKAVLHDAAGVVFVADSQFHRLEANMNALKALEHDLREHGHELAQFPWVIQYAKRDLPGVTWMDILQSKFNPYHVPYCEAAALEGRGVFKTLNAIIDRVIGERQPQEERIERENTGN